jgi:DMSO/TMAO reductase YedYZ heme-binding membrane subunit
MTDISEQIAVVAGIIALTMLFLLACMSIEWIARAAGKVRRNRFRHRK